MTDHNNQDSYYSGLSNYTNLKELCNGMMHSWSSDECINYIKTNKIGINSYIKISFATNPKWRIYKTINTNYCQQSI